ncbi:MAG: peptidylprolyl isomerase [Planctomycetota bacterium]
MDRNRLLPLAVFVTAFLPVALPVLGGDASLEKETVVVMKTTQGDVTLRFFPDKAPEHVKNFLHHAKSGLYEKTYFHRVITGFMIQGGDPNTKDDDPANDGLGGHAYTGKGKTLKAEFNDIPHLRGVLSMARETKPDTAKCQFFIMVKDNRGLDGQYTAFGRVIRGMDAVDKIVAQPGKPIPVVGGVNPHEHQFIEGFAFETWTPDDIYLTEAAEHGSGKCLRAPVAFLETTQGEVVLWFLGDKAPEHVRNFLHHSRSGLYEGTAFHRVVPGLLIQGGDPNTKDDDPANDGLGGHGYKGAGTKLKAEFNDVRHVRGVVSMARGSDPDSAGSQFFIMAGAKPALDGEYTAFGRVLEGLDVVDRIAKQPGKEIPAGGVNPTERQTVQRVRVVYMTGEELAKRERETEKKRVIEALKTPRGKQHVAVLETTQGKITIKFLPDKAPMHVFNFLEHCRSGTYKGTMFHRVFPNFMIHGGDPNTKDGDPKNDGVGGHSYRGPGTFLRPECNDTDHAAGILTMHPDSAGSQFYVVVGGASNLNGSYTAFGKVISGMSAVKKIASQRGKKRPDGWVNPRKPQRVKRTTVELWADSKVRSYEKRSR